MWIRFSCAILAFCFFFGKYYFVDRMDGFLFFGNCKLVLYYDLDGGYILPCQLAQSLFITFILIRSY